MHTILSIVLWWILRENIPLITVWRAFLQIEVGLRHMATSLFSSWTLSWLWQWTGTVSVFGFKVKRKLVKTTDCTTNGLWFVSKNNCCSQIACVHWEAGLLLMASLVWPWTPCVWFSLFTVFGLVGAVLKNKHSITYPWVKMSRFERTCIFQIDLQISQLFLAQMVLQKWCGTNG